MQNGKCRLAPHGANAGTPVIVPPTKRCSTCGASGCDACTEFRNDADSGESAPALNVTVVCHVRTFDHMMTRMPSWPL
jgi:uncharacterized protein (DUF983 family)